MFCIIWFFIYDSISFQFIHHNFQSSLLCWVSWICFHTSEGSTLNGKKYYSVKQQYYLIHSNDCVNWFPDRHGPCFSTWMIKFILEANHLRTLQSKFLHSLLLHIGNAFISWNSHLRNSIIQQNHWTYSNCVVCCLLQGAIHCTTEKF